MPVLKIDLGIVLFVLWLFCLVDAILADEHRVRNLQKTLWVLIVLFLPFLGSVAWLLFGRPQGAGAARRRPTGTTQFGEYDRPGRFVAQDPEKDEEFLRQLRERAEAQRQAYDRQRHEQQKRDEEK